MSRVHRSSPATRPSAAAALLLSLIVLAVTPGCGPKSYGPIDGTRAKAHTQAIVDVGPRPPGSANLRRVADYIESQLQAIDPQLELQRQTFRRPDLDPALRRALADDDAEVEFQNLWVEIPGTLGGELPPILALAAHYDSKITHPGEQDFEFVGALDAAASCGVLIELARHLHENPIRPDVWIVWFDGEESIAWDWQDEQALIGSQHFVDTMSADEARFPDGLRRRMKVLVLLDLLGDPELKIDKDAGRSNPALLDIFAVAADELGRGDVMYRYRLGDPLRGEPMKDDHLPFAEKGVATIDLIDFRFRTPLEHGPDMPAEAERYTPWWHTPDDTMEHVSAESLDFVGNLVVQALPKIEAEFYE